MSSQIVSAAEAVKSAINGASLSQAFTATRKWVPKVDLEDLGTLTVTVVPKIYARTPETRGQCRREIQIDIGVQKRLASTTDPEDPAKLEEIDALMQLVEEMADVFQPGTYGGARFVRSEVPDPMCDPAVMDDHNVFQSVVAVTLTRL